jgi:hypothetical protein
MSEGISPSSKNEGEEKMKKIAKDMNGNSIGFVKGYMVAETETGERISFVPGESTEFRADFIMDGEEWEELDGYVYFHPTEDGWTMTDEPIM